MARLYSQQPVLDLLVSLWSLGHESLIHPPQFQCFKSEMGKKGNGVVDSLVQLYVCVFFPGLSGPEVIVCTLFTDIIVILVFDII